MRKIVDGVLAGIIVIGVVLVWQSRREERRLADQYARLARVTGDLPIGDTTQIHVVALETGEPLHFAWAHLFPPNYNQRWDASNSGGQSVSWSQEATDCIVRVRFRQNDQGSLQVYTKISGGSGLASLGGPSLAALLQGRWDQVRVEQLGAAELAMVRPDQAVSLLRLTLPEEIQQEARKSLSADEQKRFSPVLYEFTLGSKTSKP